MRSIRSYREWLSRFFATVPEGIDVELSVQPVVIVDDQSLTSLRPVLLKSGTSNNTLAVVANQGVFILYPSGTVPLVVNRVFIRSHAGTDFTYGVNLGPIPGPLTNEAFGNDQVLEQPPLGPLFDSITKAGNTAVQLFDDNSPILPEGVLIPLDLIVLPGQYFFISTRTTNQAATFDMVEWSQLQVDIGSQQASIPRK